MRFIDEFLNKFTMYRFTLYYLIFLVAVAVFLSYFGFLNYNPMDILLMATVSVVVGFLANLFFSKLFKAVTNFESVFITALILTLIPF